MNQEELLPVVDENDQEIDQCPRNIVHTQGLRHRSVHILVFNHKQHVFLQKRSLLKDINPGLWDTSAAGHVDPGETYTQCAEREVTEELGISVNQDLRFLFKLPAIAETGMEFVQVYQCHHNGPFDLAADEIERGEWFTMDKVDQMVEADDKDLTTTFKLLWTEFRNL